MNEDITRILAYLNNVYRIENNRFINIESSDIIYGERINVQIITIFSVSETISEELIKTWAILNGLDEHSMDDAWSRYTVHAHYEPKRTSRFLISFPEHFNIQQWVVSSANRPSMYIESKKFLGFTYSKKIKWNPIRIKFLDPIGPSTSQRLMVLIKEQLLKPFLFKIEMLDPTGVVVERWLIDKTTIKSINFGELSMDDDNIATCEMVLNINDVIQVF